jgi:hypothetical protein
MPRPTLAYRSAAVAGDGPLVDRLRHEDLMFRVRWLCLLAAGLVMLWAAPALISWILCAIRDDAGGGGTVTTSWPVMLIGCAAVVIPILFGIEYVTRGRFLDEVFGENDLLGGTSRYSRGFFYPGLEGFGLILLVEIFLWGPRMTLAATRHLRAASKFSTVSFAAAAGIVRALLREEGGQSAADVMTRAGLEPSAFSDALAYLAFHDYIGIAEDGTWVWVNTDARRRIAPS